MIKQYRKKPVVIEAIEYTKSNRKQAWQFCKPDMSQDTIDSLLMNPMMPLFIETLEGTMEAKYGDYIIKGVNGEFYPCKPDIFAKTYEKAE